MIHSFDTTNRKFQLRRLLHTEPGAWEWKVEGHPTQVLDRAGVEGMIAKLRATPDEDRLSLARYLEFVLN